MKNVSTLLILIFPFQLLGDCQVGNTKLSEGAKKSLYDKGGVFENHPVQDQDGLATCYANAATSILKSVLPNRPDISYHHTAMVYANAQLNKKPVVYEKGKKNFTEYGMICDAVNALKAKGGACDKKHSKLEGGKLNNPKVQGRYFHGLGKYFDTVNQLKSDPKAMEKLEAELKATIAALEKSKSDASKSCDKAYPVKHAVKEFLTSNLQFEMGKEKPCKPLLDAVRSLSDPTRSNFDKDKAQAEGSDLSLQRFYDLMTKDPAFKSDLDKFMESKADASNELGRKFGQKIGTMLHNMIPAEKFASCEDFAKPNEHPLLFFGEQDTGKMFLNVVKTDKKADCAAVGGTDFLRTKTAIDLASQKDENNQCPYPHHELILDAIIPLVEVGQALDDSMVKSLLSPLSQESKQLSDILMPECEQPANKISMGEISCENHKMCEFPYPGYESKSYDGPKPGCHSMDKAKNIFGEQTLKGIGSGKAVGIHVCTQFFKKPTVKTNFCTNTSDAVEGHAFHDMTVTGYRCVGGRVQYEVLNSWGRGCPKNQVGADNKPLDPKLNPFDCIKDDKGPVGRFWIQEDALVDSTQMVISVNNGNKK